MTTFRMRISLLSVVAFAAAALVSGQETLTLNIDKAVALGLEKRSSLHASLMDVEGADARASEAGSEKLPSLKLQGSFSRLSDVPAFTQTIPAGTFGQPQDISIVLSRPVLNVYDFRAAFSQPLFTGFRLQSNADAAENAALATSENYVRDKNALVFDIKNTYWGLFKAGEVKKIVDETIQQVQAHVDDVKRQMDQGLATTNDLLRAQVQLSNAQLLQIDANNNVRLARLNLNRTIGQPIDTDIRLETTSESLGLSDTLAYTRGAQPFIELARQNRPEIRANQYQIRSSEAGVKAAQSAWYPQLYLTGNYYYSRPNQRILPTADHFDNTWDVNLVMQFDVWNWGATGDRTQQARVQLTQAQDYTKEIDDAVSLEVTQNYLNLREAGERVGVARHAVDQANENYRVTNEKYKFGLVLNSDVLDAQVSMLQTKTSYTNALVDYKLAEAQLMKSVGQ